MNTNKLQKYQTLMQVIYYHGKVSFFNNFVQKITLPVYRIQCRATLQLLRTMGGHCKKTIITYVYYNWFDGDQLPSFVCELL